MRRAGPYALFYTILYKGLEHPWILVFVRVLEPSSMDTQEQLKCGGNQKLYMDFPLCGSWCPKPPHCSRVNYNWAYPVCSDLCLAFCTQCNAFQIHLHVEGISSSFLFIAD